MESEELNKKGKQLEQMLSDSLIESVKDIYCINDKPQEPDFVVSLTVNFTKNMFHCLRILFPQYEFTVSSVYCHQKPMAEMLLPAQQANICELGDILFVYFYENERGETRCNSLLLQAKISRNPQRSVDKNERHQLQLYSCWPEFIYHKAGKLNGTHRNIVPKTICDGAQYLLINNDKYTNGVLGGRATFLMGSATPDEHLSMNRKLAAELVEFFKFKSGRTFDYNRFTTNDEWSKMIWDLIRIGGENFSKRKNVGYDRFGRISCYYNMTSQGIRPILTKMKCRNEDDNFNKICDNEDGDCGVSVVVLQSSKFKQNDRTNRRED